MCWVGSSLRMGVPGCRVPPKTLPDTSTSSAARVLLLAQEVKGHLNFTMWLSTGSHWP